VGESLRKGRTGVSGSGADSTHNEVIGLNDILSLSLLIILYLVVTLCTALLEVNTFSWQRLSELPTTPYLSD